jgi:glycosyltransferase involved in cell wall biosynthesis
VHVLAWRDLGDVEAGGSELFTARIAEIWAEAGLDLTVRTSYAQGQKVYGERDGYRIIRKSGRMMSFPTTILSEIGRRYGPADAMVEVWNGVPFLSPVWYHGPRVVFLHHVHRYMWDEVLGAKAAKFGKVLEGRIAPPFYRTTPILTLSESSRQEIVELLGIPARNITVNSPGIDPRFAPAGERSPVPMIVTVGRLTPTKRFDEMIRVVDEVRETHHDARLVIVGDGYERDELETLIDDLDARSWVTMAGYVTDEELVDLYRQAWLVTAASTAEGWGMTLTEAAACGTPAVATDIAGHRDSVADGKSGVLVGSSREMVSEISRLIGDPDARARLSEGARKHAAQFTWEAAAHNAFVPLAQRALRSRRSNRSSQGAGGSRQP